MKVLNTVESSIAAFMVWLRWLIPGKPTLTRFSAGGTGARAASAIRFGALLACFLLGSQAALAFTISGTVYGNGTPMPSAVVKLFLASDGSDAGQTTTNGNGGYSLTVADGTYNLQVQPTSGNGYQDAAVNGILVSGANFIQNITLLSGSYTVSGTILLPTGNPAAGVAVYVNNASPWATTPSTTDAAGYYSLKVPAGTYNVRIRDFSGYINGSWQDTAAIANLVVNADVTASTLTLPYVTVTGATTDTNGVPVPNVGIAINGGGGSTAKQHAGIGGVVNSAAYYGGNATSDSAGNYVLKLPPLTLPETVTPPPGSGFAVYPATLSVAASMNDRIVLPFTDSKSPIILSGPFASKVGTANSTIVWQTDEPSTGGANWSGGNVAETGYQTQHAITLTGLSASTPYTVTVSATDRSGNGPTTASVTFTTGSLPDIAAPQIIAGPTVSALTQNSAVVEWETNEPATTVISGDRSATVSGHTVLHRVELGNLTAQTSYTLSVNSTDVSGNGPTTRNLSFSTLAVMDVTPPVITKGPWTVDISTDAATVAWETDEPANSGVSFNDGTAYGVLNDDALTRQHSVRMTGLTASTVYNVTVSSKDAFANGPTVSPVFTLKTLATADTDAPVFVELPQICNINHQLIHLCFRTDEPGSVVVKYGLAPDSLIQTEARPQLIQQHSLPINGLTAATTYYLQVVVKDQAGNERTSSLITATTTGAAVVTNPQFLQAPAVSYQSKDRVVVEWETDRPCNAVVEYGVANYALQVSNGSFKKKHKLVITNLQAGTSYQFRVKVTDTDGNSTIGGL